MLYTLKRLVAPLGGPGFKAETCSSIYDKYKIVLQVGNTSVCVC